MSCRDSLEIRLYTINDTFKKNLNLDDNSENAELFQPVSPLNEV